MRLPAAILLVSASMPVFSQSSAQASAATFEVVSVKAVPDTRSWVNPRADDPHRFNAVTSVPQLIQWAYSVSRDFQIAGVPAWLGRERFEIQATTGRPSSEDQMRQMMQGLLADRFRLKMHRETRTIPIFALVIGKNGPRLPAAKDASLCGGGGCFEVGNGVLFARGGTMARFALILTPNMDRPVLDKTNLTGHYDFSVTYDQTSVISTIGNVRAPADGSSIFTAISDLGLKLEPQKASVEVLVIDSVDRPSAN